MNKHEWLAEQFEGNRTHLQAVAYRMLGSLNEADDAVQESWLRLSRSDTSVIENLGPFVCSVCRNNYSDTGALILQGNGKKQGQERIMARFYALATSIYMHGVNV